MLDCFNLVSSIESLNIIMKKKTDQMIESVSEGSVASDSEGAGSDLEHYEELTQPMTSTTKASIVKKHKRGIIYLSTIPRFMNVAKVREIFSQFGEVDRIFLQPEAPRTKKETRKKKPAKHFSEGWVEFKSKKLAKRVAAMLNNKQIGGPKKSRFYDHIWNIKYLPRFKWVHLNERLAYEQAVHRHRMNTEISQAKREANYYSHNLELSDRLSRHASRSDEKDMHSRGDNAIMKVFKQRELDDDIRKKKMAVLAGRVEKKKIRAHKMKVGPLESTERTALLSNIFSKK